MSGITGIGSIAVQRGFQRIDRAGDQIAKASTGAAVDGKSTDLAKPVVELHKAELETQAAIKLLEVEDKTIGRLLDLTA